MIENIGLHNTDKAINYIDHIFYSIVKKTPFVDHLDNDNNDEELTYIELYHLTDTPYRMYLDIRLVETKDNYDVEIMIYPALDPDFRFIKYKLFDDLENNIPKYKKVYNYKLIDSINGLMDYNNEDILKIIDTTSLIKDLENGFYDVFNTIQKNCQDVLKEIDNDIMESKNIETLHEWIFTDWLDIETIIDLAGFDMNDIPDFIIRFGLDSNHKYISPELAKIFFI